MMKLTLTFLATLAAAEAAHGRRHVRRDDYGYNPYPVPSKASSSAPPFPLSTGVSSSVAPSSSSNAETVPSFSLDLTSTASSELPSTSPEGLTFTGVPTGSVSVSVSLGEQGSTGGIVASTGAPYPTPSGSDNTHPSGTGVTPPLGTGVSTGLGEGEYITTTTIYSTQIQTVVITKGGDVVTSLVTSVEAIPSKCTKTSGVADTTAPAVTSEPISKVVHVSTETLTYTVGVGSTAHAVTTEIVQTSTETIYKTIVITLPYNGNHGGAKTTGGAEGPEGTTVISSTSTTTKFITVYPTPSAGAEGSVAPPLPTGGDLPPVCAPPQTVTVTEKETVTVTASKEEVPSTTQTPDATTAVITEAVTSTFVPSSAPYPLSNSTVVIGSTGFVTFTTSTGLVGTGSVTIGTEIPTSTLSSTAADATELPTDLPSFVFPSKGAVSTGAPLEGGSTSTKSSGPIGYPKPTKEAKPTKGGNGYYGYRMRV